MGSTLECIDGVRCIDNNRENTSHQRTRVRSHTQSHAPLAAEACGSDSPGCVRKLHCSVLHQQAGPNTVNTAVQMSGQPNSTPGTTYPRQIEHPCRHSVTPFPYVRYNMVSTSTCLLNTGMGNPIIGSVCNEVESHTSTICVPYFRSIKHGSRCSVNELEGTVVIRIPTSSCVTTGAREGPTEPVRIDPHCPTLAPSNLVPTTLRNVGTISTPDTQHSSVTIRALRSDPSRYIQSPASAQPYDICYSPCIKTMSTTLQLPGFTVTSSWSHRSKEDGEQSSTSHFSTSSRSLQYHIIKALIRSFLLSQGGCAHTWQIRFDPCEAQHCISQHWDFNALTSNLWIPFFFVAEEDIQWWTSAHNVLRVAPVTPTEPDTQLFTDALNIG